MILLIYTKKIKMTCIILELISFFIKTHSLIRSFIIIFQNKEVKHSTIIENLFIRDHQLCNIWVCQNKKIMELYFIIEIVGKRIYFESWKLGGD